MKMVSPQQSRHLAALFTTNVDWEAIPFEVGEAISGDPSGFGRQATRFVQNGGRVTVTMTDGIIPPPGGRVQILTVVVDESRPWDDAIRAGGPNTGAGGDIWRVGDQYPPIIGTEPILKQVVLANFGENVVKSEYILRWGGDQHLIPATPRTTFAVPEQYSGLDTYLGMNPMVVATFAPCSRDGRRHVPYVWCDGAERRALLCWFDRGWRCDYWFAFVRE